MEMPEMTWNEGREDCNDCGRNFPYEELTYRFDPNAHPVVNQDIFLCPECDQLERDIFRDIAGCNPDGTPIEPE